MTVIIAGPLTDTAHEPETCYGSLAHCFWHNTDEPVTEPFRVCLECHHAYATIGALISAHNDAMLEVGGVMVFGTNDDSEIYSCPFCSHDW